jgi:translation initiation factor 2B subunit (eIF-2B alpha/beta/delta family)
VRTSISIETRPVAQLHRLVEELTDAHEDTVLLATSRATALEWQVHLDYVRAMQRLAHETLAGHELR